MLQEYSPVTLVTAGDPLTILIHCDQDRAVPVQQSRRLIERLNKANEPACPTGCARTDDDRLCLAVDRSITDSRRALHEK